MGRVCGARGKVNQPYDPADGVNLGRTFAVAGGGPSPSDVSQALGRQLSLSEEFRSPASRRHLGYLKQVAANAAHDHFRHGRSQSAGGSQTHLSTTDVDLEAGKEVYGSQDRIAFQILLNQIDEYLNVHLIGPDQQRDRTIFWLYFRQGM